MKNNRLFLIWLILQIISAAVFADFAYKNHLLQKSSSFLGDELAQEKVYFDTVIKNLRSTQQELSRAKAERDDFEQKYLEQFSRINQLLARVENIQGAVGNLEKLSQIDPELLEKYSKVYFLSENYAPAALYKISSEYTYNPKADYFIYDKIWPFLQSMLNAAKNDGIDIKINSAYRSFYDQAQQKSHYLIIFGSGANSFSADQGYSEHQLGTTLDFSTSKIGGNISDFDKTATYLWFLDNAHKYGFILSYPKDNKYYIFEPWHWRFVGRALSGTLHQEGNFFYDLDQREINAYLINFFD